MHTSIAASQNLLQTSPSMLKQEQERKLEPTSPHFEQLKQHLLLAEQWFRACDILEAGQGILVPVVLTATEAARLFSLSRAGWWKLHNSGRVPIPIRLGRRTLWRRKELLAWVDAGCPNREAWMTRQEAAK